MTKLLKALALSSDNVQPYYLVSVVLMRFIYPLPKCNFATNALFMRSIVMNYTII